MALEPSYTKLDREAIIERLKQEIPKLTSRWTDFSDTDLGMIILNMIAALKDMQNYSLDRKVLELLLPTVRERQNAQSILKIIGYKMHTYISNFCTMRISISKPYPYDILIPAYTPMQVVDTSERLLTFCNLSDQRIPAGTTEIEFVATEGTPVTYTFKAQDIDSRGRIRLSDLKVGQGTVRVKDGDFVWEEVDDVETSLEQGRVFSMHIGREDEVYIHLSPLYTDLIVYDDFSLEVKYLISSGAKGTVGANKIVVFSKDIYDINGTAVTDLLTVVNITTAAGGDDPETIEEARVQAPREVKTMYTAVTLEDFKILAEGFEGIAKALALDWNYPESGLTTPYEINLYVVPSKGSYVTQTVKHALVEYLKPRKLGSLRINVMDPIYVDVDLELEVFVPVGYKNKGLIQDTVNNTLDDFFSFDKWDFGKDLRYSDIITLVRTCHPDIRYVHLTSHNNDVTVLPTEFIRLNSKTIKVLEEVF